MAPYATMILAGPALLLEGPGVVQWFQTHTSLLSALTIIFGSGVLAFCLNFSIFYVIHSTTAVTFNVAGNLKVRWTVSWIFHHCLNWRGHLEIITIFLNCVSFAPSSLFCLSYLGNLTFLVDV